MNPAPANPLLKPSSILLVALSLSIGWGVRGNWGHEYGAMIPGALASLAACLLSGREDWRRRATYFAFFGAVGWSFGGSISYMHVISYTHSGHLPSQAYGFACLYVIGFLWASLGGAGAAMAATLDRKTLTEFFVPLILLFVIWAGIEFIPAVALAGGAEERHLEKLYWYDTDWLAALAAILIATPLYFATPRYRRACSLILYMAVGWWLCVFILVHLLGIRMTPPRGDNWAGCLGMVLGLFVYCFRMKWHAIAYAAMVCGVIGGLGFSLGQLIKVICISSEAKTNWHSVLEQTYGFFNGIGAAVSLALILPSTPRLDESTGSDTAARRWHFFAAVFVLVVITYINAVKNLNHGWLKNHIVPEAALGLSARNWFDIGYAALAVMVIIVLRAHQRGAEKMIPRDPLARGQGFYLVFLWWIVIANLMHAAPFAPQRLVTEGVIHLNACLATVLIVLLPTRRIPDPAVIIMPADFRSRFFRALAVGLLAIAVTTPIETAVTRAIFGEKHIDNAGLNIRFGPNATTDGSQGPK